MPAIAEAKRHETESLEPFTPEEAKNLFEDTARRYMGMSGEEFLRRWDNGEFRDSETRSRAMRVAILIPLIRKISARKKSR